LQFLERTAKALGDAEEKYFQNVTLSVRARLAHLLVVLKDRYGSVAEDGSMTLELPMSRQDLAALIGTRPETMSRAVRQFEDAGIAHFTGRKVHVRDAKELLAEF
jgi:CRP/FNR family transcriptional regulator